MGAGDEFVGRVDYALGCVGFEGAPGVLEEVEVGGGAFGAFVYDLDAGFVSRAFELTPFIAFSFILFFFVYTRVGLEIFLLTIAVISFPPCDTLTHPPQLAPLSHGWPLNAVP